MFVFLLLFSLPSEFAAVGVEGCDFEEGFPEERKSVIIDAAIAISQHVDRLNEFRRWHFDMYKVWMCGFDEDPQLSKLPSVIMTLDAQTARRAIVRFSHRCEIAVIKVADSEGDGGVAACDLSGLLGPSSESRRCAWLVTRDNKHVAPMGWEFRFFATRDQLIEELRKD